MTHQKKGGPLVVSWWYFWGRDVPWWRSGGGSLQQLVATGVTSLQDLVERYMWT